MKRRPGRAVVTAATAALITAVLPPTTPAGAAQPTGAGPPAATRPTAAPKTVTLITGDRVTLYGPGRVGVQRGDGRAHARFVVDVEDGHTRVVPVDALPLLTANKVDRRLFDVTALVEFGYDDAGRADLPLIVAQPVGTRGARALARPSTPAGARVVRDLPGAVAARVDRAATGTLWKSIKARGTGASVPTVWLDGRREPLLDVSVPAIGAPAAWQAGFTGKGVKVAVVDSGVDDTHPDLAGRVVAERSFVPDEDDRDTDGHGTHVASTIAGTGAASDGRNRGVAPDAELVAAKVCAQFCEDSAIIEGMHWAVVEQGAKIVNVSLGGGDTPEIDPLEQAVNTLSEQHGALFVIAAGNAGADRSILSPGSADAALTVGAVADDGALADFSSRGPRVGDSGLKPEITGPGVDIEAARSKDSEGVGPYTTLSGTSMATPHVAGAAAILRQQHPDWTGGQLKAALMGTASPNDQAGVFGQGAGRVDVARAIGQTLTASPAAASFGRPQWPHGDDSPATKTVTLRNNGASEVTVDLAVVGAPAGLFTVGASRLTVPADGAAEVTVTMDTRDAALPEGLLGGYLTATTGAAVTRVPLAVEVEPESYNVDLTYTNRAGQSTSEFVTRLINLDTDDAFYFGFEADGRVTERLPKGRYLVHNVIWDGADEDYDASHLVQPVLDLTADRTVAVDARAARPVTADLPRPGAESVHGDIFHSVNGFVWGEIAPSFDAMFIGAIGQRSLDGLVTRFGGRWGLTTPDGNSSEYNLVWAVRDRAPVGLHRTVRDRDLATVLATHREHLSGATGLKGPVGYLVDMPYGGRGGTIPFSTGRTRTEFYTADPAVRWDVAFQESASGEGDTQAATMAVGFGMSYRPGRTYRETWNGAVFGPALPDPSRPDNPAAFIGRYGDLLAAQTPLFGDGAGHAGISTGTGTITLHRDGVEVATADVNDSLLYDAPAEQARYRLSANVSRAAPFALSTSVTCVWEFRSGHTEAEVAALPVSVVRFMPALDARHAAPAGKRISVPMAVQAQPGSDGGRNRSLTVQVSYDHGATWLPTRIRKSGNGSTVELTHPVGEGFVSLRASAADAGGNTVEQTIIRAYRYA